VDVLKMSMAVRFSKAAWTSVENLKNSQGDQLVVWYVETMKRFKPMTDQGRAVVLTWISNQMLQAAQQGEFTTLCHRSFFLGRLE